ncbi:MAG TPA: hypothetical protein VGH80_01400 [Xanthomonadaceae bacterium]|jgi:hypothetical protein
MRDREDAGPKPTSPMPENYDDWPRCDLVMKGGITSGVVYPKLMATLAGSYRFKSIGGTSAGAIAAGASAAAEFARLCDPKHRQTPFERLAKLPETLGKPIRSNGPSKLKSLFQPAKPLRGHFRILLRAIGQRNAALAVFGVCRGLVLEHYVRTAAALACMCLAMVAVASGSPSIVASDWFHGLIGMALWISVPMALWISIPAVVLLVSWWLGRKAPKDPGPSSAPKDGASQSRPRWRINPKLLFIAWWVAITAMSWLILAGHVSLVPVTPDSNVWRPILKALGWAFVAPMGMVLVLLLSAMGFVSSFLPALKQNKWGMCSGRTMDGQPAESGLTDWLENYIEEMAGIDPEDDPVPLTLGHLWIGDRVGPTQGMSRDTPPANIAINLQVMTTAISQHLPYAIPFREGPDWFCFDPEEWGGLFSERIMDWLKKMSKVDWPAAPALPSPHRRPDGKHGALLPLPRNANIPVLVAVRMSFSFPVLLSAVPLYVMPKTALDGSAPQAVASGESGREAAMPASGNPERVWFSDGGISSNLPLHFFDGPLPRWPTFAVDLRDEDPEQPIDVDKCACAADSHRVVGPASNAAANARLFHLNADPANESVMDFLWSIVETMHSWRDEIQFPYPGYGDRIVEVFQKPDEGGLNLDMPPGNIMRLSDAGDCAAQRLQQRFQPPPFTPPAADGWLQHRQTRLRTFLAMIEQWSTHPALQHPTPSWHVLIPGLGASPADTLLAHDVLSAITNIGYRIQKAGSPFAGLCLVPRPVLRADPRI